MSELNTTAAVLLSLLHDGPQNGSQLCSSASRLKSCFTLTRSQVYRELPRLVGASFARLGKQGSRAGQQYVVTPAGKKRFKGWLTESSGPDHLRSPLILRVLHAGALPTKERRALAGSAKRVYTAEYDAARATAAGVSDRYEKALAEYAAARLKAVLKLVDAISA